MTTAVRPCVTVTIPAGTVFREGMFVRWSNSPNPASGPRLSSGRGRFRSRSGQCSAASGDLACNPRSLFGIHGPSSETLCKADVHPWRSQRQFPDGAVAEGSRAGLRGVNASADPLPSQTERAVRAAADTACWRRPMARLARLCPPGRCHPPYCSRHFMGPGRLTTVKPRSTRRSARRRSAAETSSRVAYGPQRR